MRLRQSECVVKRSMKQRDLKNKLITAYPIFNTGQTAFKYRYEYLLASFPNPDSIRFEEVNRESTDGIRLSERVFDAMGWWESWVKENDPSQQPAPPKQESAEQEPLPFLEELIQFPRFAMICKIFPENGFPVSADMKMQDLLEQLERAYQEKYIDTALYQQLNQFLKKEMQALSDARKEAAKFDV